MHFGAAEVFLIDDLPNGGFDQRRAGEIKSASLGHQNLVAQHRQISAAGNAIAHDGGELRNPSGGDNRIIPKDAPEIVLIWENFILHRQKYTGGIDQIDQWQIVFECDPLRANYFLCRLREECASFHGSVIGDDHAGHVGNVANAGDGTGCRNASPLLIHFVGGPKSDLEKLRVRIEQTCDALARDQTPELMLALLAGFATAFAQLLFFRANLAAAVAQRFGPGSS
jgi:hypothetical protein